MKIEYTPILFVWLDMNSTLIIHVALTCQVPASPGLMTPWLTHTRKYFTCVLHVWNICSTCVVFMYHICNSYTCNTITKPPESGELCEEITEFVVAEDHLSPQCEGDLPLPQMKWSPHTAHQTKVVLFLNLTKESPMLDLNPKECDIVFIMNLAL